MKTYFVSGYMRSGTSMMMRALAEGGLEPAFNSDRDNMNNQWGDEQYKPNPAGFYELKREEYRQQGFPRMYEGKLLKLLMGGINRIVAGEYKIVFMRRDFEEIRQSYLAFFGNPLPLKESVYLSVVEDTLGILNARNDIDVTEVWYRDVVSEPQHVFQRLADGGWEIDPHKAASVVDEKQCRFRSEFLEVGVA